MMDEPTLNLPLLLGPRPVRQADHLFRPLSIQKKRVLKVNAGPIDLLPSE